MTLLQQKTGAEDRWRKVRESLPPMCKMLSKIVIANSAGVKLSLVKRVQHIRRVNQYWCVGDYARIQRQEKLNNARIILRVKSLKRFRYNVNEVYYDLVAENEKPPNG